MSQPCVLLVGDFMHDIYYLGEATRLSAEAPIPVVKVLKTKQFLGGAGNVQANLIAQEIQVCTVQFLQNPVKNRLMVGDTQIARWDENDTCEPLRLPELLPDVDAIVIADYGKGSINFRSETIHRLFERRVPVFVDTKQDPWVCGDCSSIIYCFPNQQEFQANAATYLDTRYRTIVTKGSAGMLDLHANRSVPALARQVRCVNGAGDTVLAAYTAEFLRGGDPLRCLQMASCAAALAVETPLTTAPTYGETLTRWKETYAGA